MWTGFAQFREDSELFSGGLCHRISAEGHLGKRTEHELGSGVLPGNVLIPLHMSVLAGPWLWAPERKRPPGGKLRPTVQVRMAAVCRAAQPLPTEQQMCPLADVFKGSQF